MEDGAPGTGNFSGDYPVGQTHRNSQQPGKKPPMGWPGDRAGKYKGQLRRTDRRLSRRSQGRSEPRGQRSLVLMCAPWEKHGPSDSGITADGGMERACRTRPAPLWRHDLAPESRG